MVIVIRNESNVIEEASMILESFSLEGKVAIVTGCNTGLGQGIALGLAEAGCKVVGVNRTEPEETIEKMNAAGHTLSLIHI